MHALRIAIHRRGELNDTASGGDNERFVRNGLAAIRGERFRAQVGARHARGQLQRHVVFGVPLEGLALAAATHARVKPRKTRRTFGV